MTIKHLRIFLKVCDEESITIAAKKLYVSQPTVSLTIKELEEYYNVKLFERYAKKMAVTEAGRQLYHYASHIIEIYGEMEENLKSWDKAGKIRIGSSITIGTCMMPVWIKRFTTNHANAKPYVKIDSSDVIEQMILNNKLDFAIVEGLVHTEDIISEQLISDELVVICSMYNPLSKREEVTLNDIEEQNLLLRERNSGTRELAESVLSIHGFSVKPIWESTSTEALINAVTLNLGISILPYRLITARIQNRKIKILKIKNVEFKRHLCIIYHKNKYFTSVAKEFMDFVKNEFKKEQIENDEACESNI